MSIDVYVLICTFVVYEYCVNKGVMMKNFVLIEKGGRGWLPVGSRALVLRCLRCLAIEHLVPIRLEVSQEG